MSVTDISGNVYGRLRVVGFDAVKRRHYFWRCVCECGKQCSVDAGKLKSGHTQSCGCLGIERRRAATTIHGGATRGKRDQEYVIWRGMHQRCYDPSSKAYENYGGRGIKVCERWRSYAAFIRDMGPRPEGLTLERIDNDGPYAPDNCVWATRSRQRRNTRTSCFVNFKGATWNLATLCEAKGVPYQRAWQRIFKLGWGIEDAIYAQVGVRRNGNPT